MIQREGEGWRDKLKLMILRNILLAVHLFAFLNAFYGVCVASSR